MYPKCPQGVQELSQALETHLDWHSRIASPLISAYDDEESAVKSARARVKRGKKGVFIAYIDVEGIKGLYRRRARDIVDEFGIWIDDKAAWHNSKHEYVFQNYIPRVAIRKRRRFK